MRNLLFFIVFCIYSCCSYAITLTPLATNVENFATATDSSGNTLMVWLDKPTQSYFFSYATAGNNFTTKAAISAGGASIITSNNAYDNIAIAFSGAGQALVLLQTSANQISYTYFTGPGTFSSSTTTAPLNNVIGITNLLAKYSTTSGKFTVMLDTMSNSTSPIFWATVTNGGTSLAPIQAANPTLSSDFSFDLDNNGNTLAIWNDTLFDGGSIIAQGNILSVLFITANGVIGNIQRYSASTSTSTSTSYSSLLTNLLNHKRVSYLNGIQPMPPTTSSPTIRHINVFFTGSSNQNVQWTITFLYEANDSFSIQALTADTNGNITTTTNGTITPVSLFTASIQDLLSASFGNGEMILTWNLLGEGAFYAIYNVNNLLGASPASSFSPINYLSSHGFLTLSVFNNIAFLSSLSSQEDNTIDWGTIPVGGSFTSQTEFVITTDIPGSFESLTVNPTTTTPNALFSLLDTDFHLFSITQP